ncbi:hypothetical protein HBI38_104280 [Parastagonospora nodorum]|nr:hypothetical protein HBI73_222850 [Parastagonospora nodorum]KAH5709137.1 hypothetical protein HBI20_189420 [Parastagonospora nodorum]KAH6321124.1 hypothetical protein HBI38_104280 [Parastagonospora nodorum]KAH6357408.1 hypothetical protein HBI34_216380 [Parastagonospora nodorum]
MRTPAFEFVETKDGQVDRTYSFGKGVFKHHGDDSPSTYSFLVHKNLDANELRITICSPFLRYILELTDTFVLDIPDIAARYWFLQDRLIEMKAHGSRDANSDEARELELLITDFLVDRNMFCGFDLQHFYDRGVTSAGFWQDMQHSSTMKDLNLVDHAFQNFALRENSVEHLAMSCTVSTPTGTFDTSKTDRICSSTRNAQEDGYFDRWTESHSRGHRILKSIQHHLNNFQSWDEGWNDPVNVEDCLQWSLESAFDLSFKEKEFLDRIVATSYHSYEIKKLICQPQFKDNCRLRGIFIIFNSWRQDRLVSENLSLDSSFRSVRRLDREEKRDLVTVRLHASFREEHRNFNVKMAECEFGTRILNQRYHKAWDKGVATIRRVLQGKRPDTLEQICRLLQVAFSMGSQDPSNTDFRAKFVEDLARWRTIVPRHSLHSFDAITKAVWNKTFEEDLSDAIPEYGSDETLLRLQELLSGLIACYPQVNISEGEPPPDPQVPQNENDSESAIDISYAAVQEVLGEMKDPRAYSETRQLPIGVEFADSILILLMAGAIFGFIIALFVILRSFQVPALCAWLETEGQKLGFENYEERNLYMLTLYVGLGPSTNCLKNKRPCVRESSVVDEASPDPSVGASVVPEPRTINEADHHPKARLFQCDRCDKQLSNVGNLNRHMRYDCGRKARFPCRNPGCHTVVSRKEYREKHERLRCRLRSTGVGHHVL